MSQTLEKVTFKTNSGVDAETYVAASDKANAWLKEQPGFSYRTLVRDEEGTWIDLVYWNSLEDAKTAAEAFMATPEAGAMMGMIDAESVRMEHLPLLNYAAPKGM